ncbi:mitochondrial chaperone [Rhizophlyctis rosea]|nr:mitochondrial chaperone [Rhizophlyctis rosea]
MENIASPAVAMWLASTLAPYLSSHWSSSHNATSNVNATHSSNTSTSTSHHSGFFSNSTMFEAGVGLLILQSVWTLLSTRIATQWEQWWNSNSHSIILAEGLEGDEAFEAVAEWALKALEDEEKLKGRKAQTKKQEAAKPIPKPPPTLPTRLLIRIGLRSADDTQVKSVIARATYNAIDYDDDDEWYDFRRYHNRPRLSFTPDNGEYTITHGAYKIKVDFGVKGTENGETGAAARARTLTLSCEGAAGGVSAMAVLKGLVSDALEKSYDKAGKKTHIFIDNYEGWKKISSRPPRSIESVILKEGLRENLMEDVQRFLSSQAWYQGCGVPYRRGYLLYGPPGTGKTSVIIALAGHFSLNVCIVNLASAGMTDSKLCQLLSDSPSQSVLLLEDVDVAMRVVSTAPAVAASSPEMASTLTLSGLLNALDGVASQEGRITFMTTNNVPALPPALLRPGRCDVRVCLDRCDRDQIARLFAKFYGRPESEDKTDVIVISKIPSKIPAPASLPASPTVIAHQLPYAEALAFGHRIASLIPPYTLTAAQLQGYFMRFMDDYQAALVNVEDFLKDCREEESRMSGQTGNEEAAEKILCKECTEKEKEGGKKKCSVCQGLVDEEEDSKGKTEAETGESGTDGEASKTAGVADGKDSEAAASTLQKDVVEE